MLRSTLEAGPFMQVTKVYEPVIKGVVNVEEKINNAFEDFRFPMKDQVNYGSRTESKPFSTMIVSIGTPCTVRDSSNMWSQPSRG